METTNQIQKAFETSYQMATSWVECVGLINGHKIVTTGYVAKIETPFSKNLVLPFHFQKYESELSSLLIQLSGLNLSEKDPYFMVISFEEIDSFCKLTITLKKDLSSVFGEKSDSFKEIGNCKIPKIFKLIDAQSKLSGEEVKSFLLNFFGLIENQKTHSGKSVLIN
jgi:hypothetical protein